MSDYTLPRPGQQDSNKKLNLSIIAARYNQYYIDALIENCLDELDRLNPENIIELHRVPGSFELPVAAKTLLVREENVPEVIIAFGLLIDGETSHAELVAQSVTQGLQNLAVQFSTPIIHQVLLVENEEQAQERCEGLELNRGIEAARAALSVHADMQRIQAAGEIKKTRFRPDKTGYGGYDPMTGQTIR